MRTTDDSLLRRLAIALGEGMAFGIGRRVAEEIVLTPPRPAAVEAAPLGDRLAGMEKRLDVLDGPRRSAAPAALDAKALYAIVGAIEKHLEAYGAAFEKRIEGLEGRLAGLSEEAAAAEHLRAEVAELRGRVAELEDALARGGGTAADGDGFDPPIALAS